jgi:hypothetical protein
VVRLASASPDYKSRLPCMAYRAITKMAT